MKINFFPSSIETYNNIPEPRSAKEFIPDWYKKINGKNVKNVKSCIPFLDSMTHGYIQQTWKDLYVEESEGSISIHNHEGHVYVRDRSDIEVDSSFHKIEFTWSRHWAIQLPDGYSGLIVHPLNRLDLPFFTISGTVDFDTFYYPKVTNIPFYIKKGFSGIIPKGTPMFQIIPVKREHWESKKEKNHTEENNLKNSIFKNGIYRKDNWVKKRFD
jgi:hypothetical protein